MASSAQSTPAESDSLCEGCGYRLNGLPPDSRCPECGKPGLESLGDHRKPTAWELSSGRRAPFALLTTAIAVILHPARFYRNLATRNPDPAARHFGEIFWLITSLLFAWAGFEHLSWTLGLSPINHGGHFELWLGTVHIGQAIAEPAIFIVLAALSYFFLNWITHLAATLTTWEAGYRGYRLPRAVVLRGMYYHAAHYLPVAAIAAATVVTFRHLLDSGIINDARGPTYLLVLSAEVVLGAFYLFETYWIGMRNMMYANR